MKTPSIKAYLAGWNHYPEGRIRNALYLHLFQTEEGLPLDEPITPTIRRATEGGFREVS